MKNLLSLFCLLFFFSAVASASNSKPKLNADNNTNGIEQQKETKTKTQKKEKYDFSLFKFITPSKTETKQDSLKPVNKGIREDGKYNGETTLLHEKPRAFLMFS